MPVYNVQMNLTMNVRVAIDDGNGETARDEAYKLLDNIESQFQGRDPGHFVEGTACTEFSINRAGGLVEVERVANPKDHKNEQFR